MSNAQTLYNDAYCRALSELTSHDIESDEATAAIKNLKTLSECHPLVQDLVSTPEPEPTTVLGKVQKSIGKVWDNETTRVLIKATGAFAGVALVTWTTVHRDHVVTREALSQANQRNS
jgi:hypothetical protein